MTEGLETKYLCPQFTDEDSLTSYTNQWGGSILRLAVSHCDSELRALSNKECIAKEEAIKYLQSNPISISFKSQSFDFTKLDEGLYSSDQMIEDNDFVAVNGDMVFGK